jgi:hypothetical protein
VLVRLCNSGHSKTRKPIFRPQLESLEERRVPAHTASISGHAFVDVTGNGLTPDDRPERGVQVLLYRDTDHNGVLDRHDRLVAVGHTQRDGSYSFKHLAPGTYFVKEVVPHGFVRTAPETSAYYTVTVGDGQTLTGEDFANFRLPNRHAVTHVTFTITHDGTTTTVTDLRGQTHEGDTIVVNVTVAKWAGPTTVSFVSYHATGPTFDPNTASQQVIAQDVAGTFGPGPHTLTLQVPQGFYEVDFVLGAAIDHFGPAGSNVFYSAQHRLISADNGGTQPQQTPGSLAGIVYEDNNHNSVFDTGDTLMANVTVLLTGTTTTGQQVSLTMQTNSLGAYSFTGLQPGTYRINVGPPPGFVAETTNAGTLGGTTGLSTISNIVIGNDAAGTGYNFAEIPGNFGT